MAGYGYTPPPEYQEALEPGPDGTLVRVARPVAPFLQPQAPTTYDALANPTSVPGGMSPAGPGPAQPSWMDALTSSPAELQAFTAEAPEGKPGPRNQEGLGRWLINALPQTSSEAARTGAPQGPGPASPGAPTPPPSAFARPQAYGGSGEAGALSGPTGSASDGFKLSLPVGGGGLSGSGSYAKDEKAMRAAVAKQEEANQHAYEAGQQQAHAVAGYAQQAADLAEAQRKKQEDFEAHRATAMDAQWKSYKEAADEVAKVNTTIDPNRFWASRTTGQRVMASLAIAAGYLGRGPQHNQALDYIQNAVQQDIDAQKSMAELALRKGNDKVAATQTLYGMMRSRFGDDATALAATQAAAFGVLQKKMDATIAATGDPGRKAEFEKLQAGIQLQQQQALQTLHGHADESAQKWANLNLQRQQMGLEFAAKAAKAAGKDPETFVPGMGFALDKEAAKLVRADASVTDKLTKKIDRLIAWREKYGAETLDRAAIAEGQSIANDIVLDKAVQGKLGALSKDDRGIVDAIAGGDPTKIGYVLPALKAMRRSVQDDLHSFAARHMDPRSYTSPDAASEAVGFKPR